MNLEKLAVCMKLGQELLGMFVFSKAYSSSWFRLAAGFHFKEGTDHSFLVGGGGGGGGNRKS